MLPNLRRLFEILRRTLHYEICQACKQTVMYPALHGINNQGPRRVVCDNSIRNFVAVEQAYFGGDQMGMLQSHAFILADESRWLSRVKKCSRGENDSLTFVVAFTCYNYDRFPFPYPSTLWPLMLTLLCFQNGRLVLET